MKRILISTLSFLIFSNPAGAADSGRSVLSSLVIDSSLSPKWTADIYRLIPNRQRPEISVFMAVRISPHDFRAKAQNDLSIRAVNSWLSALGLRLGLSAGEIDFYKRSGKLPFVPVTTHVENLPFSNAGLQSLKNFGVVLIEDAETLKPEEILQATGGDAETANEILEIFSNLGYPLPKPDGESWSEFPESLEKQGLKASWIDALSTIGIRNLSQLRLLTRIELENLRSLGRSERTALVEFLESIDVHLWADSIARALGTGRAIDLDQRLEEAVRFSKKQFLVQPNDPLVVRLHALGIVDLRGLSQLDPATVTYDNFRGDAARLKEILRLLKLAIESECIKVLVPKSPPRRG